MYTKNISRRYVATNNFVTETKQIPIFFVIFDTEKNAPIMNLLPTFLKEYWNVDNVPESGIIYAEEMWFLTRLLSVT